MSAGEECGAIAEMTLSLQLTDLVLSDAAATSET